MREVVEIAAIDKAWMIVSILVMTVFLTFPYFMSPRRKR